MHHAKADVKFRRIKPQRFQQFDCVLSDTGLVQIAIDTQPIYPLVTLEWNAVTMSFIGVDNGALWSVLYWAVSFIQVFVVCQPLDCTGKYVNPPI